MKFPRSCIWLWLTVTLSLLRVTPARGAVEVTTMISPSDPARQVYQELETEFNRTHPAIHFRIIWSDISEKMHLLAAARALPDLVTLPDFALVNYGQELLDLDTNLAGEPELARQLYPQLLDACRYRSRLKMLPAFFNVPLLYYQPALFRAAGVALPDSSWTWDNYRAAAKQLTRRNPAGQVETWGTSLTISWWVEWLGLIRQAGGDLLDETGRLRIGEPATTDAVAFMHALVYTDRSAPRATEEPAGGFMSGRYAMHYGGHVVEWTALRAEAKFDWDIAPLPAGPAGRSTGEFAVGGWGIWKGSKNPSAAWEVLSFLSSHAAGLRFCRTGLPPVRQDVAAEEFLSGTPATRSVPPRHREALIETLTFARSVPKHKDFSALAIGYVGPLIQRAMDNPDPAGYRTINQGLERNCRGYIATLGEKPTVSKRWFAVEVLVIVVGLGLVVWLTAFRRPAGLPLVRPAGVEKYFGLFISPWLAGLVLFVLGPMAISYYWSHAEYNVLDPPRFVGLAQYVSLFTQDPYFWHSLRITFLYAVLTVPLSLAVGLGLALLLHQNMRGIGIFRTLYYLPTVLPVAASGIMWAFFLNPRWGLINRLLALVGIQGPGWLYDPHWALISLAIIALWGFGGQMIIFLAGLKGIPTSLYEAASIDGAGPVKRFLHVTLPCLSPVLFFNLTIGLIGALQVFDIAYVVGSAGPGIGEPQKSTYFYVLNLFDKSFIQLNLGLGSAMAWVLFAILLAITGVNFWARRYWVHSEGD